MNPHPNAGFYCYEGNCRRQPNPKVYGTQQSLRQHRVRAHARELPQETSIGRALKRKRDAEAEELQKRQRLEEEERVAASHVPEPEPLPQVCYLTPSQWRNTLTIFTGKQDPSPRTGS